MTERSLERRVAELEAFVAQLRGALRLSATVAGVLSGVIGFLVVRALGG